MVKKFFILGFFVLVFFSINTFALNNNWNQDPFQMKNFNLNLLQDKNGFYISGNCGQGFLNAFLLTSNIVPADCVETWNTYTLYAFLYYFKDEDFILRAKPAYSSQTNLPQLNATDYWGYQKDHMFSDFVANGYDYRYSKITQYQCKVNSIKILEAPSASDNYVLKVQLYPDFNTTSAINYFIRNFAGSSPDFQYALKHYYYMKTLVAAVVKIDKKLYLKK